jgi:hypothetical protein
VGCERQKSTGFTLARAERLLREDADFASMVARIEAGSRRVLETEGGA